MFRTSQFTSESLTDPAGYFWGLSRLLTFLSFLVLASTSCCREVNVSLSSRVSSSWAIICCWISLSLRVWKQFGVNLAIQADWWGRLRLLCFLFIARYRCNRSMKVLLVRRRCWKKQVYLLSNLRPLHLQHLLLFIGVVDDVLSANQQLALHRLTKQKGSGLFF